jgi:hypothetical protein
MRRTTDPGPPALTFDSLPNVFRARSLPLKHSEQYSSDYRYGKKPKFPRKGEEEVGHQRERSWRKK